MKKIMASALALMMALSLAACGGTSGSSSSTAASSTAASSTPASGAAASSEAASEAADENSITTAEDLNGKKIGVQAGTTGEIYVTENLEAEVSSYKSGMDAALDLKAGAIDAVVLDELPAKSIVAQNDDLYIVDPNLEPEEYAIAVKKGNTELLDSINATIARMKEDGSYEALVNAFMPAEGDEAIQIPETIATEGDVIKMGTNAAFKPFEYAEGTEIVGFDITMSENIAKDMGRKLQVEDMAFDSLLSALDTGAIDFVAAGMTATEERKQSVDFSDPYFSSKQVIILKK